MNINDIAENIKNLLARNNTVTSSYDISNNLNKRIKLIVTGYSKMRPIPSNLYPAVFVELRSKKSEISQLGKQSRRNTDIIFEIVPVVNYGTGIASSDINKSDYELITLVDNIENLFINKITLSNTVDYCNIDDIDYNVELSEDTWNSMARMTLNIKKLM